MNSTDRINRRNHIENVLLEKLNAIIEKIKLNGIKDTGNAQHLYAAQVNRIIRAAVQEAYLLGVQYVTEKRKTVGFLTSTDLDIIRNQTEKYSLAFWRKVDMIIHRNDVLLQKRNYEPRSPLNSNYLATVVSIGIVTTTLALATRQKASILQSRINMRNAAVKKKKKKPTTPITDEQLDEDNNIDDSLTSITLSLGLSSLLSLQQDEYGISTQESGVEPFLLEWNAILDNATCQVCEALNGTVWQPDDPMLPTPGDEGDIHDNCRCFYDIVELP